jgi:signal transduction histidine kinase
MMKQLADLVVTGEDRIIRILHGYTVGRGYAKYTSTLEEAWRMSVSVLSSLLAQCCANWDEPPELGPDMDYPQDPLAQFGIIEAQRHRERGIDIGMFLGLLKYYRQSYLDLVMEAGFEPDDYEVCRRFVDRFYDRIELGICTEWTRTGETQILDELRTSNRIMTNEKNKYLTVFESLAHPVVLVDSDFRVDNMNQAAMEVLQGAAIPGSQYYCGLRDRYLEERERIENGGENCFKGNAVQTLFPWLFSPLLDFSRCREQHSMTIEQPIEKDKRTLHFEVRMSKMLDISEKFNGSVIVMTDITERKRAEEERTKLERQLLELRKAESLGRMAGAIAHHFNNQLSVVMGNLELALYDLPQVSDARASIVESMKASNRASEISRLMLVYLGQTVLRMEPIDLAQAIRETLPLLDVSMPREVHLRTELPTIGPIILGDVVHIKQILSNLVSNAAEAMEESKGDITVKIRVAARSEVQGLRFLPLDWEPKAYGYACLSVADTGSGMDVATREKVFDPFFSTKFTGRGLGLPVVLGLVRAHDGAITVESRPGWGAVFQVFFPLNTEEAMPSLKRDPQASMPF